MKMTKGKLLGAAGLIAVVLTMGGCGSAPYTALPPSENATFMGVKHHDGFYGGMWYGPGFEAPAVTVAPKF